MMLSGLRLLPRPASVLRHWRCIGHTSRGSHKDGDPSPPAADVPPAPAADAPPHQQELMFEPVRWLLGHSQSVEQLVQLADRRQMTLSETLMWLTALAHRAAAQGVPAADVTSQPCYRATQVRLSGRTENTPPSRMLSSARALADLGVAASDSVLEVIISDLIWGLRRMTMKELVQSLQLARRLTPTKLSRQLSSLSVEMIQRRWVEIESPTEITLILKNSDVFSSEFLRRLEDRAMDCAAQMSAQQVARLLQQLAQMGSRPLPLLRSLAYHASRQHEAMPIMECVRTLYALQKLSFPEQMLLEKVGRDLVTQTPSTEVAGVLTKALNASGQLRWRHPEFLEVAAAWWESHVSSLRPQDTVAMVHTLAVVNYSPYNTATLVPALGSRYTAADMAPQMWLNLVWSLAVLDHVTAAQLSSVLVPEFVSQLTASQLAVGGRSKLLNLAAYARLRDGHQGGLTEAELGLEGTLALSSRQSDELQQAVLEPLAVFLSPPRYLRHPVPAAAGIRVDAEFCVDESGTPVPREQYGSALPGCPEPDPRPPPGVHRVALCTWGYRDYTCDSTELTGYSRMAVLLLEMSGYLVLQVSHAEFRPKDTAVQQVKMLRQKIRDLVAR